MDKTLNYYNKAFFKQREVRRSDYNAIAKWIDNNIEGKTFGDIGCGNAYMIAYLHKLGKKVWGVDAAKSFEQYVDKEVLPYVKKVDLSKTHNLDKSDVVLCFEVAQRIDKKYADIVVKNIVSTGFSTILFTAAEPGQAGIHHINLQPREYWLDKFSKCGYYLDVTLTEKFKDDLAKDIKTAIWYLDDIMVLQKFDNQKMAQAYAAASDYIKELKSRAVELTNKNAKLEDELWAKGQQLNAIVNSKRWKASSKLIRLVKR